MIRALCVVMLLFAGSADAQHAWAAARIKAGFDGWVLQVGAQNAVLVAHKDGETGVTASKGWDRDQPIELASVSKSITALCVAVLMREGLLDAQMTSAEVLGYGIQGVSVAQLLTHSSGLSPDQTQRFMYFWLDTAVEGGALATRRALMRDAGDGALGSYHYNNENYAILGEMIAAVTGQTYAQACTVRVIEPAGALAAKPSPRTGPMLAWGGWQMPVADYARILRWGYGPTGVIGADVAYWPQTDVMDQASYGMGMFHRFVNGGHNFWHFGSWCFPLRMNGGAYAVHWANGWQVVVAYDACLNGDEMRALDRAMAKAAF